MPEQTPLRRLADCLTPQIAAARHLLEQLRLEAVALESNDAGRVEEMLAPKQAALAEFAALDQAREQVMRDLGCGSGQDEVEAWISRADPRAADATVATWRQLLVLAAGCRQQNQVNGALIQAGLRHTQQVLALLRGRPPEETTQYGPSQQSRKPEMVSGHSLGKA